METRIGRQKLADFALGATILLGWGWERVVFPNLQLLQK